MAMKKALLAVFAFAALAFAGFGSAQKFSIYTGYPLGIGGMYYLSETMRVNAALMAVPGAFGVGAGADFILGKIPVVKQDPFPINFYYGVGGAGSFAGGSGFSAFGFGVLGFGGFEYRFSEGLGLFSEFGAGPVFAMVNIEGLGSSSGFAFDFVGRFGLNFY